MFENYLHKGIYILLSPGDRRWLCLVFTGGEHMTMPVAVAEFFHEALVASEHKIVQHGKLSRHLWYRDRAGHCSIVAMPTGLEQPSDDETVRTHEYQMLCAVALDAHAVIEFSEAWTVTDEGNKITPTVPVSEHPNRIEVVKLILNYRLRDRIYIAGSVREIVRDPAGIVVGLAAELVPAILIPRQIAKGRPSLLSRTVPPPSVVRQAMEVLKSSPACFTPAEVAAMGPDLTHETVEKIVAQRITLSEHDGTAH